MTTDVYAVLQPLLAERIGRACHISSIVRRPSAYYSSFPMEDLDVTLDNGDRLPLIVKDLSPAAMLPHARQIKPAFLMDPAREVQVYRAVLTPHSVGAPTFWGAHENAADGRRLLVLERVSGRPLWQVGEFEIWLEVARWLGAMHSKLAGSLDAFREKVPLLQYDGAFYRLWLDRAMAQLTSPSARSEAAELATLLPALYERVIAEIAGLPVTFLHGEFHASNVLVRDQPVQGERVCAIDWEMAAVGPGLMDLADLTSGKWQPRERARLVEAYRCVAGLGAGAGLELERFELAFNACRLQRTVQWLGWADGNWSPPAEHAHDWLREALELARGIRSDE